MLPGYRAGKNRGSGQGAERGKYGQHYFRDIFQIEAHNSLCLFLSKADGCQGLWIPWTIFGVSGLKLNAIV